VRGMFVTRASRLLILTLIVVGLAAAASVIFGGAAAYVAAGMAVFVAIVVGVPIALTEPEPNHRGVQVTSR
jgi:uncharacterized protein (DUF58 family)